MYVNSVIFDEPRTIETIDKLQISISKTECMGVMGVPITLHIRDYGNCKKAFIDGIYVYHDANEKIALSIPMTKTTPFFQKLVKEKAEKIYGVNDFVFKLPYLEAR